MRSITIVIPAYNEEKRIKNTLRALKEVQGINRIMVVDDGSTDQTAALARQEGAEVLEMGSNRGKGGAMNAAAKLIDTDIVAFLDADLGDTAAEVEKILGPVIDGQCDLCIAAFPPAKKKGGFGLVKGLAQKAIKERGDVELVSPLSGQRAMTREVLAGVTPFYEAYGVELGMTLHALANGYRVQEVLTHMRHNETGRDLKGFLHRGRQYADLWKVIRLEKRRTAH